MANFLDILKKRQECGLSHQTIVEFQFEANQKSKPELYSKDLKAHFGCVNALAFSKNGKFLASGGDDKRILIWDMAKSLCDSKKSNNQMKGCHESNVFCIDFDCKLVSWNIHDVAYIVFLRIFCLLINYVFGTFLW